MKHLKTFGKEDILVVPYNIDQLEFMSDKEYMNTLCKRYSNDSEERPVLIIHPWIKPNEWRRFKGVNVFLTNNHTGRDCVRELCEKLNAPSKYDIIVDAVENLFLNGQLNIKAIRHDLNSSINNIPYIEFAIA